MCTATKLGLALWLVACACAGNGSQSCFIDADCQSGVCQPGGVCAPVGGTSGSGSASNSGSSGGAGIGGAATTGATSGGSGTGTGSGGGCAFTGTIDSVVVETGVAEIYTVSEDAGFDTTGQALPDGGFLWDLSKVLGNDHEVTVTAQSMGDEWFAAQYPSASYAVVLSDLSPNLGVFTAGATSIDLLGLASPTDNYPVTEVTYDPPVPALNLPLQVGSSWQVTSTVTGTLEQFANQTYTEAYDDLVDKTGQLIVPGGSVFPVLRLRTDLTRTYNTVVTTQRTYAFVTPCFGSIAAIVSQPDEQSSEFSNPSELRRLTEL